MQRNKRNTANSEKSQVSKEDGANSEFPSEYMNEEEEAEEYDEEGGE